MDEGTLEQINSHINLPITKDEIFKCVRKLKNEKASGEDEIIKEYVNNTMNQFINVYEKLFNVIFDNGIMPSSWLIGMIKIKAINLTPKIIDRLQLYVASVNFSLQY